MKYIALSLLLITTPVLAADVDVTITIPDAQVSRVQAVYGNVANLKSRLIEVIKHDVRNHEAEAAYEAAEAAITEVTPS